MQGYSESEFRLNETVPEKEQRVPFFKERYPNHCPYVGLVKLKAMG